MAELSIFHHGCIGALVGSTEQALMRPTVFWKTELQQNQFILSRALNPRFFYRGLPVAVISIAPVTCVQFGTTHLCMKALRFARSSPNKVNEVDKFISGTAAGVASAVVQSPVQIVEVNQQNHGGNMYVTAQRLWSAYGLRGFFRGFTMTAFREGFFCMSYVALGPALKQEFLRRNVCQSEGSAVATAAVVAGLTGAFLSHPADTLKTCLQGSVFPCTESGRGTSAVSRFHAVSGPSGAVDVMRQRGPLAAQLYRGFVPRGFRIVCCTYIYSTLSEFYQGIVRRMAS